MDRVDAYLNNGLFAKLLFDCMFPAALAQSVRAQGFDVAEARHFPIKIQQDDYALLEKAVKERRAIITCNYRDRNSNFCMIHKEWLNSGKVHFGIILVSQLRLDNH
jgi:hypothetical protein